MSMSNLKGQLRNAVFEANSMRQSRRSDKFSDTDTDWKIYSRERLNDLKSFANELGSFLQTEYPEVKKVTQIRPGMLQDFLNGKIETCGQKTLEKYVCNLHKMDAVCSHAYKGTKMNADRLYCPKSAKAEAPSRDVTMTEKQYRILLEELKGERTDSKGRKMPSTEIWKSVQLSHCMGGRVRETVNLHVECVSYHGGRYGYGTVTLRDGPVDGAKHGRGRTVDILSLEDQKELRETVGDRSEGKTIIQKADGTAYTTRGILAAISKAMDRVNDRAVREGRRPVFDKKDWDFSRGDHPIRKLYAQECYRKVREETRGTESQKLSRRHAIDYTSRQLGHGENRIQDLRTYVPDMW